MRRSLAAALLRSACRGSNGLGSSSIEGAVAAAAAGSVRSISSIGNGSGGARFSSSSSSPLAAAATTTSFSSRGGAASCSQQASPAASNWKSSAPFFSCCRGIHNSSGEQDWLEEKVEKTMDLSSLPKIDVGPNVAALAFVLSLTSLVPLSLSLARARARH